MSRLFWSKVCRSRWYRSKVRLHILCSLILLYTDTIGNLSFDKYLTLSQTSPVEVLKTLWETEKLLVRSNFSFSHGVFYPFWELSIVFIKFEIVVCKFFQFGSVQNLNASKLKEFADDNLKIDCNDIKLSRWLENTVGKGEIACYKQFLLFPLCFQKTCTADT